MSNAKSDRVSIFSPFFSPPQLTLASGRLNEIRSLAAADKLPHPSPETNFRLFGGPKGFKLGPTSQRETKRGRYSHKALFTPLDGSNSSTHCKWQSPYIGLPNASIEKFENGGLLYLPKYLSVERGMFWTILILMFPLVWIGNITSTAWQLWPTVGSLEQRGRRERHMQTLEETD